MSAFKTVTIPIERLPDGREFIGDFDVACRPEVGEFVRQFSNYWTRNDYLMGWVGPHERSE